MERKRVAFMSIPCAGHILPTLAIIRTLVQRHGAEVDFYGANADHKELLSVGAKPKPYYQSLPGQFHLTAYNPGRSLPWCTQPCALALLPWLIKEMQTFRPHVIVHDHLAPWGQYVSSLLGIPDVCLLTGMIPDATELEDLVCARLEDGPTLINTWTSRILAEEFNISAPWQSSLTTFSSSCNLVFTTPEFHAPFVTNFPRESFHFLGPTSCDISLRLPGPVKVCGKTSELCIQICIRVYLFAIFSIAGPIGFMVLGGK
jgi:hypothetical protein